MDKKEMVATLRQLGWKQADLARKVNVDPTTICRYKVVPGPVAAYLDLAMQVKGLADKLARKGI